ncbi:MAG: hypothetical protein LR008_02815 [Candidatus Pacebacteria bacterium]|nr:hypothetical protein [Candidatus Paceibacterota bacterium]
MEKTPEIIFGFAVLFLMGLVFWHMTTVVNQELQSPVVIVLPPENVTIDVTEFRFEIENKVRTELGQPIEGFEPFMFMQVFPSLLPQDFDGVEATIGHYEYRNSELVHELGKVEIIHSAAQSVTEEGIETLLVNVTSRLQVGLNNSSIGYVIESLSLVEGNSKPSEDAAPITVPPIRDYSVACTMDARICPDGSAVGRLGPDCEFAACSSSPSEPGLPIECSPESKKAEACNQMYAPVCGEVAVQCITAPCYPVQQTFSNSCSACAQGNVNSYTKGECLISN